MSVDYNDCIAINQEFAMSSITVRNLDESVKSGLRVRAAHHGWSMEQEVRQILQQAVESGQAADGSSFAEQINRRFAGLQTETLAIPPRHPARKAPGFDKP